MAVDPLGRYRFLDRLGEGGFGVVYRALAPDGRAVAVKLLKPEADLELLARFDRERRLMDQLDDAGFVPLLDYGASPRGPYLVMELMPGGSLAKGLARKKPMEIEKALGILRPLARAMGRAHARGIVHRDLKPANILFDAEGRPRVTDLGIAKRFLPGGPGGLQSASLTAEGTALGTLAYMAPEQLENAKLVGPQTDVYALGAILYELICGRRLHEGSSAAALMMRASSGRWTSIQGLRPDCPDWLVEAIERCLETDPKRRFADGRALAAALRRPRPRKTGQKGRWLIPVSLMGAAALILAALTWLTWRRNTQASAPRRLASSRIARKAAPPATPLLLTSSRPDQGLRLRLEKVLLDRRRAGVARARLSPDGTSLSTIDSEGRIREWEGASGQLIRSFRRKAVDLAFSADGRLIFGRSPDERLAVLGLRLFRGNDAGLLTATSLDLDRVSQTVFSEIGAPRFLLACGERLVHINNQRILRVLDPTRGLITGRRRLIRRPTALAALEPNRVLVGRADGVVTQWQLEPLKPLRHAEVVSAKPIRGIAADPENRQAFIAADGRLIRVSLTPIARRKTWADFPSIAGCVAGQGRVYAYGDDGRVLAYDSQTRRALWQRVRSDAIRALAVSEDGRRLAGLGPGDLATRWDLKSGELLERFAIGGEGPALLSLSPKGEAVLVATAAAGTFWCQSTGAFRRLGSIPAPISAVLARSPSTALIGFENGRVLRWDGGSLRDLVPKPMPRSVRDLELSGSDILAYHSDGTVLNLTRETRHARVPAFGVGPLRASAGKRCVWVFKERDPFFVDIKDGARGPMFSKQGAVSALELRRDGRLAAVAFRGGDLGIFDLDARKALGQWSTGEGQTITALAFAGEDGLIVGTERGLIARLNFSARQDEAGDGR